MKNIEVSIDVFAEIWARRVSRENTEDEILRRILGLNSSGEQKEQVQNASFAVKGSRYRVQFPEGFIIFRSYRGQDYRASMSGGYWLLETDGTRHPSLNSMSRAVGAKTENAWQNWYFWDETGHKQPVTTLRDPSSIPKRRRLNSAEGNNSAAENMEVEEMIYRHKQATWRDDVKTALESLGGRASLQKIYSECERIRRLANRSVPLRLEATIRRTLEDHSSDSNNYRGGLDLFYMPEGKGAGVWALRE